jgi:hypothetical protein
MNIDVWPAHAQGFWDVAQSKNTRMRNTRHVAVAPSTAACAATVRGRHSRISRQTFEDTSSLLRLLHFISEERYGKNFGWPAKIINE